MKIRTGFVSNSSSSSFIIDCNDDKKFELISAMINSNSYDYETSINAIGKDEIKDYYINECCYDLSEIENEINDIEEAKKPIDLSISYDKVDMFNILFDYLGIYVIHSTD